MISVRRIRALFRKELSELFGSGVTLWAVLGYPPVALGLGLVHLYVLIVAGDAPTETEPVPPFLSTFCGELTSLSCVEAYSMSLYQLLFLTVPVILATTVASTSVCGEKAARCLEPLLATPLRTWELLVAKGLAAVIPAVVATWVCWGVWALVVAAVLPPEVTAKVLTGAWIAGIVVLGPLLAILSTEFALVVSTRVQDTRSAQQLSGLVVLPVLMLVIGQATGILVAGGAMVSALVIAVALVAAIFSPLVVWMFEREQILTQWR